MQDLVLLRLVPVARLPNLTHLFKDCCYFSAWQSLVKAQALLRGNSAGAWGLRHWPTPPCWHPVTEIPDMFSRLRRFKRLKNPSSDFPNTFLLPLHSYGW